jgi:3-deoxy-D-manno-octulosonic-acid transferase
MVQLLYNVFLTMLAPMVRLYLRRHTKYHPLVERFSPKVPPGLLHPVWVHACSVGEVVAARPLLRALRTQFGEQSVLLTVSTVTGRALAEDSSAEVPVTWFPFDTPSAVRSFFGAARPRALLLVETEIWPNVLREAGRRGVPVFIVNGRISDRHYTRFQRFARLFPGAFPGLHAVAAQSAEDADRYRILGVPPSRVQVLGSAKFDAVRISIDIHERARLRRQLGLTPDQVLVIFGSTRPGDEALAAECWATLKGQYPDAHLLVAPRHVERVPEILPLFPGALLRSHGQRTHFRERGDVMLLDTVGELATFYSIATVAVIGGSFFPGVEGHNPIEPAALGIATIFGPYMKNFAVPARALLAQNAAVQVPAPGALCAALQALLADTTERRCLGTRGRRVVLENRGTVDRTLALIVRELQQGNASQDSRHADLGVSAQQPL